MANILFWPDIYLEQGHWLPCISIAQALQATGQHTVKFMGIPDCESLVTRHNATGVVGETQPLEFIRVFEEEYPLGYTKGHQHKSINERWKPDHLLPLLNGELDSRIAQFGTNADQLPDLIVGGYFAAFEALILHYRTQVRIMVSTTYLRHPQDDPGIFVTQKLLSLSDPVANKIIRDLMVDSNDSITKTPSVDDFVEPLMRARELIPCPLDFEFDHYIHNLAKIGEDAPAGEPQKTVFFTEPCVSREETPPVESDGIDWVALQNKKVIFATAGSQVLDYENKARTVFQKLISLMKSPGMSSYHLVLGVGSKFMKEKWIKDDLPNNVSAAGWIDQRKAMNEAKVVFIHGGLATIKEALISNVPIVILPLGKDQMDNALRLRRKNLSVISYAESLSLAELRKVIVTAQNDPQIKPSRTKYLNLFKSMEGYPETDSNGNPTGGIIIKQIGKNPFNYSDGTRASIQVIEQALADA